MGGGEACDGGEFGVVDLLGGVVSISVSSLGFVRLTSAWDFGDWDVASRVELVGEQEDEGDVCLLCTYLWF
jgi:hypothetical protein